MNLFRMNSLKKKNKEPKVLNLFQLYKIANG